MIILRWVYGIMMCLKGKHLEVGKKKYVMLKGFDSISQGLWLIQFEEFGLISGKMLTGSKRQNLSGDALLGQTRICSEETIEDISAFPVPCGFFFRRVSPCVSTKWHRRRDQACLPVFELKLTPNPRQGRRGHGEAWVLLLWGDANGDANGARFGHWRFFVGV